MDSFRLTRRINTISILAAGLFLLSACQSVQYPKNSLEVTNLTTQNQLESMFRSPAYPVGEKQDRINISFDARVLENGDIEYTMWLAFPRKQTLNEIQSGGNNLNWEPIPADPRITLVQVPITALSDPYIIVFEGFNKQVVIPKWWIEGFQKRFENIANKNKIRAESRKGQEKGQIESSRLENKWETLREKYISKRRKTDERIADLIANNSIGLGMNKDDLIYSWGEPDTVNKDVYTSGVHEQWVYRYDRNVYVYFRNGILTSWQKRN